MKPAILFIACLFCLLFSQTLHADLFTVSLIDNDGPQILGQVETATDALTVTSWSENAGGTDFWSPALASLPLTYTALNGAGAEFDVPDNWDGTIDFTWGFVADLRNADITWNDGTYMEPNRSHGWGAGVDSTGALRVNFLDHTRWQWPPTGATTVNSGTFDTITVTRVPEPTSIALYAIGSLGLVVYSWRRQSIYSHKIGCMLGPFRGLV